MKMQKAVIFVNKRLKIKNIVKSDIIIQVNIALLQAICVNQNIAYPKNFLYFFTIDLTMTIIKQLTEENIEKYITFLVPIEKEVKRISKTGDRLVKIIHYRLKFIESARFMTSSFLIC